MDNLTSNIMTDELRFKAKIIDMGTKKIIIIPVAFHEQLTDFNQNEPVIVTLKQAKSK